MDDIFIFSCSVEEHERHLGIVFDRLRKNHRFLSKKKVNLYSERMECLGHIIDDRGIHTEADKMQWV
jgi:Reverse transcriptase (RNA-dependent DNA polymerase)